jgi:type II secretion system protein I
MMRQRAKGVGGQGSGVTYPTPDTRPLTPGFTLIESVAALAIASIALVALLELHLVSIRTADKAQAITQAVLLAQEKMAEALSTSYPPLGVQSGEAEMDGTQFTWQTEVTDAHLPPQVLASAAPPSYRPTAGRDRLRQLSVEVSWQGGPGEKHVSLTTYVAENGNRDI